MFHKSERVFHGKNASKRRRKSAPDRRRNWARAARERERRTRALHGLKSVNGAHLEIRPFHCSRRVAGRQRVPFGSSVYRKRQFTVKQFGVRMRVRVRRRPRRSCTTRHRRVGISLRGASLLLDSGRLRRVTDRRSSTPKTVTEADDGPERQGGRIRAAFFASDRAPSPARAGRSSRTTSPSGCATSLETELLDLLRLEHLRQPALQILARPGEIRIAY